MTYIVDKKVGRFPCQSAGPRSSVDNIFNNAYPHISVTTLTEDGMLFVQAKVMWTHHQWPNRVVWDLI